MTSRGDCQIVPSIIGADPASRGRMSDNPAPEKKQDPAEIIARAIIEALEAAGYAIEATLPTLRLMRIVPVLYGALEQLLHECTEAGFEPSSLADAEAALARVRDN